MAQFEITIQAKSFYVEKKAVIETECASIYEYEVFADELDVIDITLLGNHDNEYYTLKGVDNSFTDNITGIIYNESLLVNFIIENSGNPGVFNETTLTIDNNTQVEQYIDTVVRENDEAACVPGASAPNFDTLSDTPGTKIGSANKIVAVSSDELTLEYINITITDKHYEHDQAIASAIWTINHNLNKFPSTTIVDSAGDRMRAAVNHIDNNNLTITFISSTSGKAYLN